MSAAPATNPMKHSAQRADPVIVEGQLEEPRYADKHRQDADAIEPLRSDAALKRTRVFSGGLIEGAKSRRSDGWLRWPSLGGWGTPTDGAAGDVAAGALVEIRASTDAGAAGSTTMPRACRARSSRSRRERNSPT